MNYVTRHIVQIITMMRMCARLNFVLIDESEHELFYQTHSTNNQHKYKLTKCIVQIITMI